MKLFLGSDHGGFLVKEAIKEHLLNKGYEVEDLGTDSSSSCDYPLFGIKVGEAVASNKDSLGIVVCSTGVGISIAANKVKGIRCALCWKPKIAEMCRKHNDANVLSLPGLHLDKQEAIEIVDTWLSTDFEGDRHTRRVNIINDYDNKRGYKDVR